MTDYELFARLHQQEKPFLLGNAWDAHSARLFEKAGFPAIGTSSLALANALGYEDGENISFRDLLFVVERILRSINIPLSVDFERGYGNSTAAVIANIEKLHDIGVVGINLEDSFIHDGQKQLTAVDAFSQKLNSIRNQLDKTNRRLFINARTDAYILKRPDALAITLERVKAYEKAGASGVFVPFVSDPEAIKRITAATQLPVNVLSAADLPLYDQLTKLGVKRISLGATAYRANCRYFEQLIGDVQNNQSLAGLF